MAAIWDAIIVGARCAGAVTALCLARRGHRVLVLDRAHFPSDTLSTHFFGRETVLRLADLDLLDPVLATGAPPLTRMRVAAPDAGVEFTGRFRPLLGFAAGYCVRRILLDDILVRAARAAGAEVREGVTVTGLIWHEGQVGGVVAQDHRRRYTELGQVVVGADGRHSWVARWVRAPAYLSAPATAPCYYAYYRGLAGPRDVVEQFHTDRRDYVLFPTNDDLTCVLVALPQSEVGTYRMQHERHFEADLRAVRELADRCADAERVGPVRGATDLESYLRVPAGPGWLLVGDAAVHVHPLTARGIGLAVRDALLLAEALATALEGLRPPEEALAEYHHLRDLESRPSYEEALRAAERTGRPLPPPVLRLWSALAAQPEAADRYVSGELAQPVDGRKAIDEAPTPDRATR
jgi:flavin-dependent dehydrogenase